MPNWVYNNIGNYPKEVYEKYKSDDGESDIDFQKIIPIPEEVERTISGSINDQAKSIVRFRQYQEDMHIKYPEQDQRDQRMRWDKNNPLNEDITRKAERTAMSIGEVCIENPEESLNQLLQREENEFKWLKGSYDSYVSIYGNRRLSKCKDYEQVCENYIKVQENDFEKTKNSEFNKSVFNKEETLEDYGKRLISNKEKYGYEDWYSAHNSEWGTKWNACEADYDPENQQIKFDTAWSIPYPIIAKIAEENPEVKLDGYSEEESGWFEEYKSENGKLAITARGELQWEEDTDKTKEVREEITEPKYISYSEIASRSKMEHAMITTAANNLKARL